MNHLKSAKLVLTTSLLGAALLIGVMVPALTGPKLLTLEETVAAFLDDAERGDLEALQKADPDCADQLVDPAAAALLRLAQYRIASVDVHPNDTGTVVIEVSGPLGTDAFESEWELTPSGVWMGLADGSC